MTDQFQKIRKDAISVIEDVTSISIPEEDITVHSRNAVKVFHRALVAFYLIRKGYTTVEAGKIMGNRAHCTVINMLNYGLRTQAKDLRYESAVEKIKFHFTLCASKTEADYHLSRMAYHRQKYKEVTGV